MTFAKVRADIFLLSDRYKRDVKILYPSKQRKNRNIELYVDKSIE